MQSHPSRNYGIQYAVLAEKTRKGQPTYIVLLPDKRAMIRYYSGATAIHKCWTCALKQIRGKIIGPPVRIELTVSR